ncbi:TolC family protein [Polaribacter tangerinus]|uniref:TolC family protein n=1 Tax=Polaribacter tangerinus TaxID=1920034 RepID=UPI000B4BCFE6|nr:TolC family protein [Polaribacter tangerinus]
MKKSKFIIVLALFFIGLNSNAQNTIAITKEAILEATLSNNLSLKIVGKESEKAVADFKQSNALFLPNITASHTGFTTTNPLMAFGSKLNQEILTASDFNPTLLNNPSRTQNFATRIAVEQPLINLDGVYERKAAKSKIEAMALQTIRTKEHLTLEVAKAYMQLQLSYKALQVATQALQTTQEHYRIAHQNFKQGLLQKASVLNIEVRLTEVKNHLQTAKSNVQNASDYISFLMNNKETNIYKPQDSLSVFANVNLSEKISEDRADIQAMGLSVKGNEAINKATKMSFLPRVNAFATYELYDNAIFTGNASGYLIGAAVTWNIFEGSKKIGKLQKSKAVLETSKLAYQEYVSKSNLEFNKAQRMLLDLENKLELTQLAVQQSKESLRIRTNRFKEGLEKSAELLQSETQYAQKQLEYYKTIFEYNYTVAYLAFLAKE